MVAARLEQRSYSAGEVVVRKGDKADTMCFIYKGSAGVYLENPVEELSSPRTRKRASASSHAMKHRLITLPDPLISRMPTVTFSISGGSAVLNPTMGTNAITLETSASATILVKQQMPGTQSVPIGLTDTTYTVLVNSRFLALGGTANLIDTQPNSKIASYTIPAEDVDDKNASSVSIQILRKALDDTTYTQFGDHGSGGSKITSILSVIGDQSGLRKDIKVTIKSVTT